ncbi:MAG: nickel pincer cofactor biosynthesis protein LarC [Clostridia bacterium]|nr:nickel pincer cofactor biosynthesis protein LarC [Clostridia bacterium]
MKTLYLECGMGAAGDMLMAALLELIPDQQTFLDQMNGLNLPGVALSAEPAVKCGITGTHMRVTVHGEEEESIDAPDHDPAHHHDHEHDHHHDHEHEHAHDHSHHHDHEHEHTHDHEHDHDHEHAHDHDHSHPHEHHHHASPADIDGIIDGLAVPEAVKRDAKAVYALIAQAESRAHGRPISEIHYHEVGTMDAVADVVGVCWLMHRIGADEIVVSPVHVGSGFVRCMHGILPVPAPATAAILEGVPTYGGAVQGELCTPTGAALLKHFATRFGDRPLMATEKIGYGMGKKDFERANCVRAFLGRRAGEMEEIVQLECNLDDMTGEAVGFAMEQLFLAGARDVYTVSIGMKKSRPGVMLCCVCLPQDADALAALILRHTTTLGVRRVACARYTLPRTVETVDTPCGPVRVKVAKGPGFTKSKAEYDDLARIARDQGIPLDEAKRQAQV